MVWDFLRAASAAARLRAASAWNCPVILLLTIETVIISSTTMVATTGAITFARKLILRNAWIFSISSELGQVFDSEREIHLEISRFRNSDFFGLRWKTFVPRF